MLPAGALLATGVHVPTHAAPPKQPQSAAQQPVFQRGLPLADAVEDQVRSVCSLLDGLRRASAGTAYGKGLGVTLGRPGDEGPGRAEHGGADGDGERDRDRDEQRERDGKEKADDHGADGHGADGDDDGRGADEGDGHGADEDRKRPPSPREEAVPGPGSSGKKDADRTPVPAPRDPHQQPSPPGPDGGPPGTGPGAERPGPEAGSSQPPRRKGLLRKVTGLLGLGGRAEDDAPRSPNSGYSGTEHQGTARDLVRDQLPGDRPGPHDPDGGHAPDRQARDRQGPGPHDSPDHTTPPPPPHGGTPHHGAEAPDHPDRPHPSGKPDPDRPGHLDDPGHPDHPDDPGTDNPDGPDHRPDGADRPSPTPPSRLRLPLPHLPVDGGVRTLSSLLPLDLRLGPGDRKSPWCLPEVSLGLGDGGLGGAQVPERLAVWPAAVRTPLLVLTGLTYRGIREVETAAGPRRVLAFTALRLDISDLRQDAALLGAKCPGQRDFEEPRPPDFRGLPGLRLPLLDIGLPGIGRVPQDSPNPYPDCLGTLRTAGEGTTSTATGEPVVLLTELLSGNLLGLLPVTFTPDMPPPLPPGLTLPIPLFFTDVIAHNRLLQAEDLTIPKLHQTLP